MFGLHPYTSESSNPLRFMNEDMLYWSSYVVFAWHVHSNAHFFMLQTQTDLLVSFRAQHFSLCRLFCCLRLFLTSRLLLSKSRHFRSLSVDLWHSVCFTRSCITGLSPLAVTPSAPLSVLPSCTPSSCWPQDHSFVSAGPTTGIQEVTQERCLGKLKTGSIKREGDV